MVLSENMINWTNHWVAYKFGLTKLFARFYLDDIRCPTKGCLTKNNLKHHRLWLWLHTVHNYVCNWLAVKALTANHYILDKPFISHDGFSFRTYLPARHNYATLVQNDFQNT